MGQEEVSKLTSRVQIAWLWKALTQSWVSHLYLLYDIVLYYTPGRGKIVPRK